MNTLQSVPPRTGCGGTGTGTGTCACQAGAMDTPIVSPIVASINGMALHAPDQSPDTDTLRELAYTELLRQQAVAAGLLPRSSGLLAPEISADDRLILESMVDAAVQVPLPTEEECLRYFAGRKTRYVVGQAVRLRHILFAVTAGVNVQALTVHAEKALIRLLDKGVSADLFGTLAAELSNCPSSSQGGDLGWVGPNDCAPELAQMLFFQSEDAAVGLGVQPRLIHSRFGFHIVDVQERREGRALSYDAVREQVVAQLTLQSRAKALHQYMRLLVGQAQVEGVELDSALDSVHLPPVQ